MSIFYMQVEISGGPYMKYKVASPYEMQGEVDREQGRFFQRRKIGGAVPTLGTMQSVLGSW